jgi:signal recognition particle subunit SRP54
MFDTLTSKLDSVFKKLRGKGVLTEQNITDALREVRLALLEADVNFKVVKEFTDKVKERAIGQEVLKQLSPGQQVIKIVHEELIRLMSGDGNAIPPLKMSKDKITKWMVIGLQGSGKTTATAKIANNMKKQGYRPMLAAGDIYRPAAIKQLELLGQQIKVPVFSLGDKVSPVKIAKGAVASAEEQDCNLLLIDTAGRLHIDEELMKELQDIKSAVQPDEIFLVCDAMTGQDAVNVAQQFHKDIGITGVILTKLDGDARGGAILSIRSVTGQPVRFVGVGEKIDDLELFHPDRMASRILGMGDVLTLIEKAQGAMDMEEAQRLEQKLRTQTFTLEDFRSQIKAVKNMGPLGSLMEMIPGMGKNIPKDMMDQSEVHMKRVESIINSMTPQERLEPAIIGGSRRQRIARGSGTTIQDVNQLLKQYEQMKKMMKAFGKGHKSHPGNLMKMMK